mmetsp:Transcript_101849/g.270998  ORF Transcript_101849/g.270998 Transcript_101849/m.270998 type:complete len:251 (-) Transcript_101849:997-1749(-)
MLTSAPAFWRVSALAKAPTLRRRTRFVLSASGGQTLWTTAPSWCMLYSQSCGEAPNRSQGSTYRDASRRCTGMPRKPSLQRTMRATISCCEGPWRDRRMVSKFQRTAALSSGEAMRSSSRSFCTAAWTSGFKRPVLVPMVPVRSSALCMAAASVSLRRTPRRTHCPSNLAGVGRYSLSFGKKSWRRLLSSSSWGSSRNSTVPGMNTGGPCSKVQFSNGLNRLRSLSCSRALMCCHHGIDIPTVKLQPPGK